MRVKLKFWLIWKSLLKIGSNLRSVAATYDINRIMSLEISRGTKFTMRSQRSEIEIASHDFETGFSLLFFRVVFSPHPFCRDEFIRLSAIFSLFLSFPSTTLSSTDNINEKFTFNVLPLWIVLIFGSPPCSSSRSRIPSLDQTNSQQARTRSTVCSTRCDSVTGRRIEGTD